MRIGELADRTGLTTKTIRYYEDIGILPEPERMANGYRTYSPTSVERLSFVKDAQAAGLSLAEIGMVLDMRDHGESTCDHVVTLLETRLEDIDRQMEDLQRAWTKLTALTHRAKALDPTTCRDPNRCQTIVPATATDMAHTPNLREFDPYMGRTT